VTESIVATDAHPEPTRRLPREARTLWRLEAVLRWIGVAVGVLVVGTTFGDDLPDPVAALLWIVPVAGLIVDLAVTDLRWRTWRYEIRDEEIDLRRGALNVTRTLVPMARIQHVDTRRGALEQVFKIATVAIHTAAGATSIPALKGSEADEVRDRIAALTRTPDEL
jgi:hypothetical protein